MIPHTQSYHSPLDLTTGGSLSGLPSSVAGGTTMGICGYALPSRPGHSRVVSTSYAITNSGAARAALALATKPLLHAMLNEVLDGDLLLVAAQERNLRKVCGTLRLLSLLCPAALGALTVCYAPWTGWRAL